MYNSRLDFRKRQGANKALCELAPMRAILFATRDIKAGEEILLTKGWSFYQQANPVAASATEQ